MAVKLHRCSLQWLHRGPCWRVEKALIAAGIEYERVPGPSSPSRRDTLFERTGQRLYPVIELEDGTWYREESKEMAARIRAGRLRELPSNPAASGYLLADPGL
jgi:hypothetical protein